MLLRILRQKGLLALTVLTAFFLAGWQQPAAAGERLAPSRGTLLVAGEGIVDPRFHEAVILLLRYDAEGAVGIVLNRPTTLTLGTALAGEEPLKKRVEPLLEKGDETLYFGGPVAPRLLLVLLQCEQPPQDSKPISGQLYLTGLPQIAGRPAPSCDEREKFRVFFGYAGWSVAQLSGEIARGDWYVVPFDEAAVFSEKPETLWRELREGGKERWI